MAVSKSTNKHYDENIRKWKLIDKMLTGEKVSSTLVEGAYEATYAFKRRKKRADWKPYTRDLVSRLTGELFTRGGEVSRDTVVSQDTLSSIGPNGESYSVQLFNLAETLVAFNEAWVVMDPSQGMLVVEPQHVPRWNSNAVVLKGTRNKETSIFSDQQVQDAWTVYYDNEYEVYVKSDEDGKKEESVESGMYVSEDWSFSSGPPALRIELPWKVKFGHAIARAHRAIYRMESKVDEALTNSLGGLIQIATGGDEDLKNEIEKALKGGSIAIPYDEESGEHKPLNVGIEGLAPGQEALKRKRKELYRTAHQALDQASKRMSATEADARNRSGSAAALSMLSETMQSAEESILPMIAESEDRRNASRQLSPSVDWPTDFSNAFDNSDEELITEIFGKLSVPVDVDTATDVIVSRIEGEGFAPDRDAIRSKVKQKFSREAQADSASGFDLS